MPAAFRSAWASTQSGAVMVQYREVSAWLLPNPARPTAVSTALARAYAPMAK